MTSLEIAYQEGVKLAMAEAGLFGKYAGAETSALLEAAGRSLGQSPETPKTVGRLARLLQSSKGTLARPLVHRSLGGAALGGTIGGLTGDEDSSTLARILGGAAIGGGVGAGSYPAQLGLESWKVQRGLRRALGSEAAGSLGQFAEKNMRPTSTEELLAAAKGLGGT